jgi:hypothetical protein
MSVIVVAVCLVESGVSERRNKEACFCCHGLPASGHIVSRAAQRSPDFLHTKGFHPEELLVAADSLIVV